MFSLDAHDFNHILKKTLTGKTMFRCKDDIFYVSVESITPQQGEQDNIAITREDDGFFELLEQLTGNICKTTPLAISKHDKSCITHRHQSSHQLTFFCDNRAIRRFHYDADFMIHRHKDEGPSEHYLFKLKIFNYANLALLDQDCCHSDNILSEEDFDTLYQNLHNQLKNVKSSHDINAICSL